MICGDILDYYGYNFESDIVVPDGACGVRGNSQMVSPVPASTITALDTTTTIADITEQLNVKTSGSRLKIFLLRIKSQMSSSDSSTTKAYER